MKRQIFRVAFDQFQAGIFAAAERHQSGADVKADARIALAPQQLGEYARSAAEVGNAGAAR